MSEIFDKNLAGLSSRLKIASIVLSENMRSGNFRSMTRGQGIEFSDVREYLPGDNVRAIDWNVTAKMGRTFIKQYEEDRELNVFSSSTARFPCSPGRAAGPKSAPPALPRLCFFWLPATIRARTGLSSSTGKSGSHSSRKAAGKTP